MAYKSKSGINTVTMYDDLLVGINNLKLPENKLSNQ